MRSDGICRILRLLALELAQSWSCESRLDPVSRRLNGVPGRCRGTAPAPVASVGGIVRKQSKRSFPQFVRNENELGRQWFGVIAGRFRKVGAYLGQEGTLVRNEHSNVDIVIARRTGSPATLSEHKPLCRIARSGRLRPSILIWRRDPITIAEFRERRGSTPPNGGSIARRYIPRALMHHAAPTVQPPQ
jgi:hypothetical protein